MEKKFWALFKIHICLKNNQATISFNYGTREHCLIMVKGELFNYGKGNTV